MEIKIWFPTYQNNLGVVSKLLRNEIGDLIESFGVTINETYFSDKETYLLDIELEKKQYLDYILNKLYLRYGNFISIDDLQEGDVLLGRLVNPGKVGFGIFVDIGIRSPKQDILLPLYQLREDFEYPEGSAREIVQKNGLIDGFPLSVEITEITTNNGSKRINGKISDNFADLLQDWNTQNTQKLLITKKISSLVSNLIRKEELMEYIDGIDSIDPLTSVIHCKSGTRADGLIPLLGPHLKHSPIGIYSPNGIL